MHRERSYHGMNAYGTSLAGIPGNLEGFGTLVPETEGVNENDTDALEQLFSDHGERIAAFIGEPVIGAGGIFHPTAGYWDRVQELCRRHDVLLIADEVICGFGRLGTWFGCHRFGITPDLVTCAKGLTSGYLPLGAVLASQRVQEPFFTTPGAAMFRHGYTYSGHPAACAAGLANLDVIERENLVERVAAARGRAGRGGRAAAGAAAGVRRALRGRPAGGGRDRAHARAADPSLIDRLVAACRERGVLTRGLAGHSLQISPPFVISEQEISTIAAVFADALSSVELVAVADPAYAWRWLLPCSCSPSEWAA